MNISAPFIHRPVATILLTAGVALCGAVAFMLLPVAPLPRIDVPAIFVSAQLPGASPEVMASTVATPLERHLGAIADVDDMTSSSSVGTSNIQLTFGVDRDIDGAARDVQAAIVAAHADLPSSLTRNPSYRKLNSALFPVMAIAMTSDVLTQGQIYDAADAVISQRLSQIQGVGGVNVNGSALPAVRVEINPLSLSKYGIGLQDVRAAISNANANAPKGALESDALHYQIYTNDNARDAGPYRSLIIANRNGATVRLGDVATVLDMQDGATENIRTYGLYNGKPAVFVTVYQQPGANVIEMIDAVKAELPLLKSSIDPKIDLVVTFDRSITIRASLRQVEQTLMLAVAFVILVVYIFLNSYRAALIPALVVPVSLIGTFGAMYLLNYTLDNFSLMALTVATGFVVDDAIVVMENTTRHIEGGMSRLSAALLGAREVGFTVVSMSLSLVAVFIPFMFAGGIVGKIFREFTVTLSVAILISLVISLTTTPMMCSLLLVRENKRKSSRFGQAFERSFARLRANYERTLDWALHHPRTMMLLLCATVGLNIYMYIAIPKGFFPQQDTGQLQGGIRGDAQSSFQMMKRKLQEVAAIIQADPAVNTVTGSVGSGGFGPFGGGGASANVTIALKPLAERHISADQIIARLRPKLNKVTGVASFLRRRRTVGQLAISIHAAWRRFDRIAELVAKAAHSAARHAGDHRCGYRHAAGGTRGRFDRGPRQRIAAGTHGDSDRQCTRRCICAGSGVEHLQPLQPTAVPRRHGGGARVLAEPRSTQGIVRQHVRRRRVGYSIHPGRRRHYRAAVRRPDDCVDIVGRRRRGGLGAQSGAQFSGECGPRQYLHRLGRQRRRGDPRAVCGIQSLHYRHDSRERQSHRNIRVDRHCIQLARGRITG
jgi:multidrug efflux pump